jgi:histone acetyltransferase (RNA polymerase elongator complex component)
MLRAIGTRTSTDSYDFDVMGQFQNRIKAYKFNGSINNSDKKAKKLEIILSGGTWHSYPEEYRTQVVTELYWAANTMNSPRPIKTLQEEINENETAEYRIIGQTAETRPDQITPETIIEALNQGFTRFQLGEQTDNDVILKKVNRKCYKADSIRAHRLLKQAGFKLVVHLMPDLPGSSPEEDKRMFNSYLTDPGLQFDDVKIYPTAICKSPDADRIVSSKIAEWHKQGLYTPYAEKNVDSLVDVIMDYKRKVSPHVRIQRVVRDIPGQSIEAGYNKKSNLRQMIHDKMKKLGYSCNCIYCKEIGDQELDNHDPILVVRQYDASEGTEYHLSMEAHKMTSSQKLFYNLDRTWNVFQWLFTGRWNHWTGNLDSYTGLYGFCRLRIDPSPGGDFLPVLHGCGLIREVHVYGFSLGVGTDAIGSQHRGYGKLLVNKAEEITALNGLKMTAVIAGVGTREYYKNKCGYHKEATYMKKYIKSYNYYIIERVAIFTTLAVVGTYIINHFF